MAEKRGETVKLEYDFNTAGCLEVYMKEPDAWYRATSREFRSFNGPRRITEPQYVEKSNVNVPMVTYEYYGPVYQFGTNNIIAYSDTGSLAKNEIWERARRISENRGK